MGLWQQLFNKWKSRRKKEQQITEMLAPAAITLRRPSGEVDLILSKKDFVICRYDPKKRRSGTYSPPARTCQSANTSPVGSNLPSPSDSIPGSTSSLQSPEGFSPTSSPHKHRKSWFHKVTQLKEDADKINKRMKESKSSRSLRGSVECLKTKLSGSKKDVTQSPRRTLRVEKITSSRKSKRGSKDDTCILSYDQPDHNFTTSLLMTNLEEGFFSAELSLDNLPVGNITIRIRDYKLEIVVDHHQGGKDSHHKTVSRPYYCGSIAIPIYVVPETLEVSLNEDRNVLELRGMTKGYQYQRMSASTSDLRSKSSPSSDKRKFKKMPAGLHRVFNHMHMGKDSDVSANGMSSLSVSDSSVRDRAYTR